MEITEGKLYFTREGKIAGPVERARSLDKSDNPPFWYWRVRDPDEGWLHWTAEGKWFRSGAESPRDLVAEAPSAAAKLTDYTDAGTKQAEDFIQGRQWSMTKKRLLELAIEATSDRGLNYGRPEDNFSRIAAHWNAFLFNRGIVDHPEDFEGKPTRGPLTGADVALMCALLKIARLENSPTHQDSWVDLAGYAACGAEIALAPQAQSSYNPNKFSPSTAEKLARKQD